jgi:sugar/nucleoside kinase (ribokinase family)
MVRILVSGLINIETTLRVAGFPLAYNPVNYPFYGIDSSVSGVGYNVAKALTVLGNDVRFCSLIGGDWAGTQVRSALANDAISGRFVLDALAATAQSVILYDPDGRRQIHTDLKDVQEQRYPETHFDKALAGTDLAALCNINFSRPLLEQARKAGVPVATDVHAISDLDDSYNSDFMAAADVLFMSDDLLPVAPEEWAESVIGRYRPRVLVIGLGAEGALLAVPDEDYMRRLPALRNVAVVSTIGAGDALFSSFLHGYIRTGDPHAALRAAIVFAGHKLRSASAAQGFLSASELARLTAGAQTAGRATPLGTCPPDQA